MLLEFTFTVVWRCACYAFVRIKCICNWKWEEKMKKIRKLVHINVRSVACQNLLLLLVIKTIFCRWCFFCCSWIGHFFCKLHYLPAVSLFSVCLSPSIFFSNQTAPTSFFTLRCLFCCFVQRPLFSERHFLEMRRKKLQQRCTCVLLFFAAH